MTVLVVDDEPTVPRMFAQRYRKEIRDGRYRFVFAATGLEALERLGSDADDAALVLSDIAMPGMNGMDLVKSIRHQGRQVPVYMVSAYEGTDYERQAKEAGATGFLTKPLVFADLNKLLERLELGKLDG